MLPLVLRTIPDTVEALEKFFGIRNLFILKHDPVPNVTILPLFPLYDIRDLDEKEKTSWTFLITRGRSIVSPGYIAKIFLHFFCKIKVIAWPRIHRVIYLPR